jgi:chromosome segregation ATPase
MPEPTVDESNVTIVKPQGAVEPPKPEPTKDHPGLAHLAEEDKKMILSLREEAAAKRVRAKELESELETIKSEQQKIKEQKLKEDGKLQELLEQKELELQELSGIKSKVEKYESYFKEQLDVALEELTETEVGFEIKSRRCEGRASTRW